MMVSKRIKFHVKLCLAELIYFFLRAANILVKGQKIKIADFGSTTKNDPASMSKITKIERAWRWTPPELKLDRKLVQRKRKHSQKEFTSKSDVYSFGCVIYEILRLGEKPFARYSNFESDR